MNIVFVTQIVPYPPHGGVLQRGYNLLRELGKAHEVHLIAFHHPDTLTTTAELEHSRAELGQFLASLVYLPLWPKQSAAHRLVAFAAALPCRAPFSVLAHRSAELERRLNGLTTAKSRPDIVHLDTIALAPFRRSCNTVPCVLGHHNIESQLMRRRAAAEQRRLARAYTGLQASRLQRYEARQCPEFPLNIVVSEQDAIALEAIAPGSRTAVIPNGVDVEYFRPTDAEEGPTLAFTGGMNMFANRDAVEWFIEAVWPLVTKEVANARFLAVGQNPSNRVLQAAKGDTSIEAPGFVPDIRPWVSRAAIYVVPLRVGGGTRLKVVDAMAQGKAIVSTTLGAEGIDAQNGKHLLLADSANDFAAAVVSLLCDGSRRKQLGSAARQCAEEKYAWPPIAQRLADRYQQVVAEYKA